MYYTDKEWFRDIAHVSHAVVSNANLDRLIIDASQFIDRVTRMWFVPRTQTQVRDGSGLNKIYFSIPIISITSITMGTGDALSSSAYKTYNRISPDDRQNPKIVLVSTKFIKGFQNVSVVGSFGYVDANLNFSSGIAGEVGTATIVGAGLDDLTASGTYTGDTDLTIRVYCDDDTLAVDTYKYSVDGGVTWRDVQIAMEAGVAVEVYKGVFLTFLAQTGHTKDDYWTINVIAQEYLSPSDIKNACNMIVLDKLDNSEADSFAQMEKMRRVTLKSERTTISAQTYIVTSRGDVVMTGIQAVDDILYRYRQLSNSLVMS